MRGWNREAVETWARLSKGEKRLLVEQWAGVAGRSRFEVEDYALARKRLQEAAAAATPVARRPR